MNYRYYKDKEIDYEKFKWPWSEIKYRDRWYQVAYDHDGLGRGDTSATTKEAKEDSMKRFISEIREWIILRNQRYAREKFKPVYKIYSAEEIMKGDFKL